MFKAAVKDELKVPAHIDYLGELRNFVTKTGKKHGFSESIVNAFKLSVDEAATNIIKHAYRDEPSGEITMRIVVKRNSMTVILIDQGRYFDPTNVKDPDLKRYVDIGKKGGLGIFMMRKLIDQIDYRNTEEGNELRMTKFRDGTFRRRETDEIEETGVPTSFLSFSLKTRYSLIAAGILTFFVMIGYIYNYVTEHKRIIHDLLRVQKAMAASISGTIIEPGDSTLTSFAISSNIAKAVDLNTHDEIYRVLVLDNSNQILYSSLNEEEFFTIYRTPENLKKLASDVFVYKLGNGDVKIYDIIAPVLTENNYRVGTTRLQIKSEFVDKTARSRHFKNLRVAILILLMGYAGVFILVYLILNPFNKLADWIKDLGHGDVEDEIDFDTRDEVGEIAKAFSEITDKFRQSQANLAEQERLQKEMQLAQDIQQTLLPPFVPEIEGYEIASLYQAAKEVGGDYYDFVEVDKDSLGIVVADVSGKGVPGSLIMTMIRTALRTEARGVKSASEVLARLNQFVVKDMKKGMFVTIFYVIIDSKRRRLNYASAGHNPMILYRPSTQKTYYLNPKGFPVGIALPDPELFKKSIESDTIQLVEDDVLLIYTDGITEAMNRKRNLFGEERLLDAVKKYSNLRVKPFTEKLREEITSFTQGFEQNDDITLVVIKEKSTPEKIELHRAQTAHRLILDGMSIRESCQQAGITTYAYYNKYKKIFEEEGLEAYEIDETISVEAKHLSIEEKTKIYDLIKKHPEYGAKRISEELNTERYEYTVINESKVYDELVRSRLNTRQLREAYVSRAGKKKHMKPPGTPMMTLDGRIILDRTQYEIEEEPEEEPVVIESGKGEKTSDVPVPAEPKELDDDFYIESLMSVPIEELLHKKRSGKEPPVEVEKKDEKHTEQPEPFIDESNEQGDDIEPATSTKDFFFSTDGDSELADIESGIDFVESPSERDEQEPATEMELEQLPDGDEKLHLVDDNMSFRSMWDEQVSEIEGDESDADDESTSMLVEADLTEAADDETSDDVELAATTESSDDDLGDIFDDEIGFESLMETGTVSLTSIVTDEKPETMEHENMDEPEPGEGMDYPELDIKENLESFESEVNADEDITPAGETTTAESGEGEHNDDAISFHDLLSEIERDISLLDEASRPGNGKNTALDEADEIEGDDDTEVPENGTAHEKYVPLDDESLVLGLKYYKDKRYDDAIREFEALVQVNPKLKEIYSMLGNSYFRNGMLEKALEAYQRVIELDPKDADAYENIGVIYANQGEYERAIAEWKRLLALDPSRQDILKNVERARLILEKDNINV